jgi:hypothetical protein
VNKKAIQLSINFIILFILATSMFATGLIIVRQVFQHADDIKKELSEQQRDQLERMLIEGTEKVKTAYTKKELYPGEHEVFGLGVRNDFDDKKNFFLERECDAFIVNNEIICEDGTANDCNEYDKYLFYEDKTYLIEPNERNINEFFIMLPKDAQKGTYVYNVRVCYRELGNEVGCIQPSYSNQYGTTKKFNVIVK